MSRTRGYTLLELLIVGALVAVLVGLAMPAMRRPLARSQLRGAAAELRIALAKTRLRAIESGGIWTLRYQPGSGRFAIAPRPAPIAAEGFETADAGDELAEEPETQQLDNDILFHDPETAPVAAQPSVAAVTGDLATTTVIETVAPSAIAGLEPWSAPVFFYPTGRTSSARFRLLGRYDEFVDVTLRGLTGSVKIGKLQSAKPAQGVLP